MVKIRVFVLLFFLLAFFLFYSCWDFDDQEFSAYDLNIGKNWEELPFPVQYFGSNPISHCLISDDGNIIILLSNINNIARSEDGGYNWVDCTCSDFTNIISASSSNDCTIIGIITNDYVYLSYDKGNSWNKIVNLGVSYWKDIEISADGSTIVVLDRINAHISRNGGLNWETIQFNDNGLKNCGVSDFGDVVVILSETHVYTAKNKTNAFIKHNITLSNSNYFSFDLSDCLISSDGKYIVFPSLIFSTDYGSTFKSENLNGLRFSSFALSKDGQYYLGVEYYNTQEFSATTGYIHLFSDYFGSHEVLKEYDPIYNSFALISNDNSLMFILAPDNLYASKSQGEYWMSTSLQCYSWNDKILKFFLSKDNKKLILVSKSIFVSSIK